MKKQYLTVTVSVALVLLVAVFWKSTHETAENWTTYNNIAYGYEISYPSDVQIRLPSKGRANSNHSHEQDTIVVLAGTEGDEIFGIVISVRTQLRVESLSEMQVWIEENETALLYADDPEVSEKGFKIARTVLNGHPAVEVSDPRERSIWIINARNQPIRIATDNYDRREVTAKAKTTNRILNSIVLDPE